MMVNCGGTSRYSATTFTPPSEISVIVQSRGSEPAPHWILAILLHTRRSLLRRSAYMSFVTHRYWFCSSVSLAAKSLNEPSDRACNVVVVFRLHLPNEHLCRHRPRLPPRCER